VADVEVILKTYLNEAEVDSTTTKTDAEGYFVFDGLSTELDYSYDVIVNFQQAEYYGERLSFNEGETSKFTGVNVYDATTNDEAIKVATAHTIIYIGQGSLQVKEYFLFVNEADRTYVGPNENGDTGTLTFSLPQGATELQSSMGLMDCCIVGSEGGFIDTMPVLPGSKEVAYSYKLPYSSQRHTLSQTINYPIINFDLLIQGEGIEALRRTTRDEPDYQPQH